MNIKLPYKILLIILLFSTGAFAYSPFIAKHSLSDAIKEKNNEKWLALVNDETMKKYSRVIMKGLFRLRMNLAIEVANKTPGSDSRIAYQDYTFAMKNIDRQVGKITDVKGIPHLLCGEITRFPNLPPEHDKDCWVLDGQIHWESLNKVKISYKIPQSDWFSNFYLERTGLLNWQVVAVELPVNQMFEKFINGMENNNKAASKKSIGQT